MVYSSGHDYLFWSFKYHWYQNAGREGTYLPAAAICTLIIIMAQSKTDNDEHQNLSQIILIEALHCFAPYFSLIFRWNMSNLKTEVVPICRFSISAGMPRL